MTIKDRRNEDTTVQVIAERVNSIQDDVTELKVSLKDSMKEISAALNKLVQIEVQNSMRDIKHDTVEKDFKEHKQMTAKMENRLDAVEKELGTLRIVKKIVFGACGAILLAVVGAITKILGLV
jgi:chromosome segregation ATPase